MAHWPIPSDISQGILQHAWRTKRIMQENALAMPEAAFQSYSHNKRSTIHHALRQWRVGWPDTLVDFEPLPEHPSLYQDRAAAYWYLAGIVMLPHVAMSSPKTAATTGPGRLSVQETL